MAIQSPSNFLFLTLVTFLVSLSLLNVSMARYVNEKVEISPMGGFHSLDVSDPKVVEVGKYAVDEYNKEQHKLVNFQSVATASKQELGEETYKYDLLINGSEYDTQYQYSAIVLDKKNGQKTLVAFKKFSR